MDVPEVNSRSTRKLLKKWAGYLAGAALALLILFAPFPLPSPSPAGRHLRIEASMFQYTPGEWTVNPGDRVTVELVSTDVWHGFSLDGYGFELKAGPGQTVSGSFIAEKPGVFRFRCSVPCGNMHPFMIGELKVGPNQMLLRGIALVLFAAIVGFVSLRNRISTAQVPHAA